MALMRSILLAGSHSDWLREHAPRFWFIRRTAGRFMPGETVDDALAAAAGLQQQGVASVLTLLGENVTERAESAYVRDHYIEILARIRGTALPAEVSVKLTQLGLDLGPDLCYSNLEAIIQAADVNGVVWVDMEASNYTDVTLGLYRRARAAYSNVGICLQAYLHRTAADLAALIPLGPAIRLVKGAYMEPPDRAFPRKQDVDENFFKLAGQLLGEDARRARVRTAIATHDLTLIRRIQQHAQSAGLGRDATEFQMLYGIQRDEQLRLAREGWRSRVLISYGSYWFPWFMRRLAERPANVLFLLRHMFGQ
jgi:proline dehydrogenase